MQISIGTILLLLLWLSLILVLYSFIDFFTYGIYQVEGIEIYCTGNPLGAGCEPVRYYNGGYTKIKVSFGEVFLRWLGLWK